MCNVKSGMCETYVQYVNKDKVRIGNINVSLRDIYVKERGIDEECQIRVMCELKIRM